MKKVEQLTVKYHDQTKRYKWHLAPAYDLTWCAGGYNGEHATSVNGTGNPAQLPIGYRPVVTSNIPAQRCQGLYRGIKNACVTSGLLRHEIKE